MLRLLAVLALTLPLRGAAAAPPRVVLNEAEFRDRVHACWIGKSIGGTLGVPLEGRREMHGLTFYDPVPTTQAANDDLDLQLLWLKALEERGPRIGARVLGEYWLRYVPVDWNEYGIGKANMRNGFPPPVSGHYRNVWRDSNGAWIRSEIWACVAPGRPELAARYAWEDASVDHGAAEGTWAEVFTAALESAAFVEHDRDRLLGIALSYVPPDSALARAVRAAISARGRGLDLAAARAAVVAATESTGWFMAPRNVAFTVLGWLYGDGDFGRSLCAAVNCGDDTDCTGATLGALWGILHGTAGIPDAWRKPVGEGILNVAIGGFRPPATLGELTDRTVAMAKRVLAAHGEPVAIASSARTDAAGTRGRLAAGKDGWKRLARSPWVVSEPMGDIAVDLDLGGEPELRAGSPRSVRVSVANRGRRPADLRLVWVVPDGLGVEPAQAAARLQPGTRRDLSAAFVARGGDETVHRVEALLRGADGRELGRIPFALAVHASVRVDDLALASKGATATSDSELDREAGGTARAIDGEIPAADGFDARRWHSALSPHPHWLAIHLPRTASVGRVIAHFADPGGHPVDFDAQASDDGTTWRTLFEVRGHADPRRFERAFGPAPLRHFRLLIRRSASAAWPDAAQLGEVELLPR